MKGFETMVEVVEALLLGMAGAPSGVGSSSTLVIVMALVVQLMKRVMGAL